MEFGSKKNTKRFFHYLKVDEAMLTVDNTDILVYLTFLSI